MAGGGGGGRREGEPGRGRARTGRKIFHMDT